MLTASKDTDRKQVKTGGDNHVRRKQASFVSKILARSILVGYRWSPYYRNKVIMQQCNLFKAPQTHLWNHQRFWKARHPLPHWPHPNTICSRDSTAVFNIIRAEPCPYCVRNNVRWNESLCLATCAQYLIMIADITVRVRSCFFRWMWDK